MSGSQVPSPSVRITPSSGTAKYARTRLSWLMVLISHCGRRRYVLISSGRVTNLRIVGKKLVFVDALDEEHHLQYVINLGKLDHSKLSGEADAQSFFDRLTPNSYISTRSPSIADALDADHVDVTGHPYRTEKGELSLLATEIPLILSRSYDPPSPITNDESKIRQRHRHLLTNPQDRWKLKITSIIKKHFRHYLDEKGFEEYDTPILANEAGGAHARAFDTRSTEFPDQKLQFRVAPELWLKRLIISGYDKVYEIGPCFRNEGLDRTHNPEFRICEFYQVDINLSRLMEMTKEILQSLSRRLIEVASLPPYLGPSIPQINFCDAKTLDFIPALEASLGRPLPDLASPEAHPQLLSLCAEKGLTFGKDSQSLPQLLAKLGSHYLDPQCDDPTFIAYFPECMCPLAKSFTHPGTGQRVAANADFVVRGIELVNICEEENDLFEQQRKLGQQASKNEYLEAMETGLPPTGGFGCGLDRLAMLMTGSDRLRDVLTFGTLRNTANVGKYVSERSLPQLRPSSS